LLSRAAETDRIGAQAATNRKAEFEQTGRLSGSP
jgi:hypothetical protein